MQFAHNGYYKGSIPFGLNILINNHTYPLGTYPLLIMQKKLVGLINDVAPSPTLEGRSAEWEIKLMGGSAHSKFILLSKDRTQLGIKKVLG